MEKNKKENTNNLISRIKARANADKNTEEKKSPDSLIFMSSKQKVFIVIGMIIIIGVSFVVGLFIGQQNAPKNDLAIRKVVGQTFYANIESIKQYNDGSFHINVKGLEINDINYRGNFTYTSYCN